MSQFILDLNVESPQVKCECYWPEQSQTYGDITVSVQKIIQTGAITIRSFSLKKVKIFFLSNPKKEKNKCNRTKHSINCPIKMALKLCNKAWQNELQIKNLFFVCIFVLFF